MSKKLFLVIIASNLKLIKFLASNEIMTLSHQFFNFIGWQNTWNDVLKQIIDLMFFLI